jgi:hypothetical protein
MVNGKQIAAARVWLGISQAELALASAVAQRTIAHLEGGGRILHERTLKDIVTAMEKMGVEFLSEENVGVGIRIEDPKVLQVILDARAAKETKEKKVEKDPTKKAPAKKAANKKSQA